MKNKLFYTTAIAGLLLASCGGNDGHGDDHNTDSTEVAVVENFEYVAESFGDIQILRYQINGFDQLSLDQQ